ncbi:MAG: MCP four helix bundle domain-containing protein [Synergistaceae bacterium]|jgi:methyl-accepting chemotaxis protein|nr:MCP four helix bundle domain-containing protein [Synergistaceae bacterium]
MQWFRNLRTASKILLLVAVMIVLLVVVSAAGYHTSRAIADETDDLYSHYAMPAIWMEEVELISTRNSRTLLSVLNASGGSGIESYDSSIKEGRNRIDSLFGQYAATNQTDEEKAMVSKIRASLGSVGKFQDEAIDAVKNHRMDDDFLRRISPGGDIANAENESIAMISELVAKLVEMADDVDKEASVTARARYRVSSRR